MAQPKRSREVDEFIRAYGKMIGIKETSPVTIARKICDFFTGRYLHALKEKMYFTAFGWFWARSENSLKAASEMNGLRQYMDWVFEERKKKGLVTRSTGDSNGRL